MRYILEEELKGIDTYSLCFESNMLKRKNLHTSVNYHDAIRVVTILEKYSLNYCMDENHNFIFYL